MEIKGPYLRSNRKGLNSQGIKPQWGQNFQYPSRATLGPIQPPVQLLSCLSGGGGGGVWPGYGINHRPWSSTKVKEGLQIYLSSQPPAICGML